MQCFSCNIFQSEDKLSIEAWRFMSSTVRSLFDHYSITSSIAMLRCRQRQFLSANFSAPISQRPISWGNNSEKENPSCVDSSCIQEHKHQGVPAYRRAIFRKKTHPVLINPAYRSISIKVYQLTGEQFSGWQELLSSPIIRPHSPSVSLVPERDRFIAVFRSGVFVTVFS